MSREKKAQAGCYLEGHQSARVGLTDQGGGEANAAPKQMSAEGPHVLTVAQVRLAAAKLDKMLGDKQISYGSTIPAPSTADHGGTKHWSVEGEQGGFSRKWGSLNSRFGVIGVERGQWASRNCVQNISSINIS